MRLLIVLALTILLLGSAAAVEGQWQEEPLSQTETSFQFSSNLVLPDGDEGYPPADQQIDLYSDYYSSEPPSGSGVERYSLTGQEPAQLYLGGPSGQTVSFSTYQTTYGSGNSLWIQGANSWTQYAVCPLGSYLRLLAYTSSGGMAEFFEIYPSNRLLYRSYSFYPGYSRLTFHGDEIGRHVLLFLVNNQPSNAVSVDVTAGGWPSGPVVPGPGFNMARVTVRSSWLKGFNVVVDGSSTYNDVSDGSLDGVATFVVSGNSYHNIRVSSVGYSYLFTKYFRSGYAYTLSI